MEYLPEDQMLKFNKSTLIDVRKGFGLDSGNTKQSVQLLEEWVEKQNHFLKKDFDKDFLERMLIGAKGSVERTKERLDRTCTFKTLIPQFFQDFDAKNDFKDFFGIIKLSAIPKLTPEHDRVFVSKVTGDKISTDMLTHAFQFCVMQAEYHRAHDYANSILVILDYSSANVADMLLKLSLVDLQRLTTILIEGYGLRAKGIHLILDTKFADIVLSITKKVVPMKLGSRIKLHRTPETLKDHIDKDVLPKEYGGNEKSLAELTDDWVEIFSSKEFREYWRQMSLARTDESKRESGQFNEQYMGMPGSFRSLTVD